MEHTDSAFTGSIPQLYDRFLVPLIFEPYARDLARRTAARRPQRVLEIAAGTGVVTRQLALQLPAATGIVASDLNQPMLDEAARIGTARAVTWRQADAMQLPFENGSFDAVVCQFGAMFFPDKSRAFGEVHRVLRPSGTFLFNVWDRIEANEMISVVCAELDRLFPDHPPRFMHRGPHGYSDPARIRADLRDAGFDSVELETVRERSSAASPREPVIGYCHGSPLRLEIEAQGADALARATDAATHAMAARFGAGRVEGTVQALVGVALA